MKSIKYLLSASLLSCVLAAGAAGGEQGLSHHVWDSLLIRFVNSESDGAASRVDYDGFAESRQTLSVYLTQLALTSIAEFKRWPVAEQLAFLINAYNAWTVDLILEHYPGIESIRDIGFLPGGAWRHRMVDLFGQRISLNGLEHEMIRGWDHLREPRIHFAVNCAAVGCPALSDRAYTGEILDEQLEDSTRQFLKDRTRNYMLRGDLHVSPIFRWYRKDFEDGWGGYESLPEFLVEYGEALGLSNEQQDALIAGQIRIQYSRYDWSLNSLVN